VQTSAPIRTIEQDRLAMSGSDDDQRAAPAPERAQSADEARYKSTPKNAR
jgi:hypothetical protein